MNVSEYFVTLCVRPAEMRGLQELPAATKDRITPIVLVAPWPNSSPLSKALARFEEAFGDRQYYVDVDSCYQINGKLDPAKEDWALISQRPAQLATWYDLLHQFNNANPCILMAGQTIEAALDQIAWARLWGRSFCLRFNLADMGPGLPPWIATLMNRLSAEGLADYAIHFDYGWVKEPLQRLAATSGLIQSVFSGVDRSIPIGVSCTSFPRDFTWIDGVEVLPFDNRSLIEQLRRATNHPRIIYGDWATTRPRVDGRGSTPKNRIDFPLANAWLFRRNQEKSIDFKNAAKSVVEHSSWKGDLNIWGEQMIQATADDDEFAIDTMPKMYQCRINIHLHRQAFHGQNLDGLDLDEELPDDF